VSIILRKNRPAIDIIQGGYSPPEEPWAHLGEARRRAILQAAIPSIGRGAFLVGPNLLLTVLLSRNEAGAYAWDPFSEPYAAEDLYVDFGHEVIPSEPVRVRVEEVLYDDERTRVQLLRANVPESLKPLRLSVKKPEELLDREVALIGYPAADSRIPEQELMASIFRDVYDVKRLLPGRIMRDRTSTYEERSLLLHDCSSTGGCAGAPLVDIETGEVLGIHFAGLYLRENRAIPSWELARDPNFSEHGVLFAGPLPEPLAPKSASLTPAPLETTSDVSEARVVTEFFGEPAPDDASDADLDPSGALETIVLKIERPAFLVDGGRPQLGGLWEPRLKPHEPRLALAIRAVGKLRLEGGRQPWVGTAFVVGDGVAITASDIVTEFASGTCSSVEMRTDVAAMIDFSDALSLPSREASSRVVRVRFIHPFFQISLLELDGMPAGVAALDLAAQMPSKLASRNVVVLSFVDQDARVPLEIQESVYAKQWGRLFVRPGLVMQLGHIPEYPAVPALLHDCLIQNGSAGAPVVDLETGYVIGIHTHGQFLQAGYAQPTWEIARDPNVWGHPIRFRPDPRPPWLGSWDSPHPVSQLAPLSPAPKQARWTVDEIPIDFQRAEPRQLEQLLVQTIAPAFAVYFAENVGLPLGSVNPSDSPTLFWRKLLKAASLAGVLRRLIQAIADAPEDAGIAPKLRDVL
jgi:hypothetical protein